MNTKEIESEIKALEEKIKEYNEEYNRTKIKGYLSLIDGAQRQIEYYRLVY